MKDTRTEIRILNAEVAAMMRLALLLQDRMRDKK